MNDDGFVPGMVLGFIIAFTVMGVYNYIITESREQRAIEVSVGQYNPQTGTFEWLDKDVHYAMTGEK